MFESLKQPLSIGPFNFPPVLVSLLLAWIVYRIVIKRFYVGRLRQLKAADGIIFNAFFILLVVWKLSPVVFQFSTVSGNPSALLYLPGGVAGTVAGIAAAVIYCIFAVLRRKEHRITLIKNLALNSGALTALVVVTAFVVAMALSQAAGKPAGPGSTAPGFVLDAEDGATYELADYNGSTVVLNFWASWCPPCRAELPELKSFYSEEVSDSLVFLSINLYANERDPGALPAFIKQEDLPFPVLYDKTGSVSDAYRVSSIPTTVIIDGNGIIKTVKAGAVTAAWLNRAVSE